MNNEKYQAIISNYINGNISDAIKQVKRLSKFQVLRLVEVFANTTMLTYEEALRTVMKLV